MGRRPRNKDKLSREPAHALYDDIDAQPRIATLSSLTPAQQTKKALEARKTFLTRRVMTTSAMLKRRARMKNREGADTQVYTEVLMDVDEEIGYGPGGSSESESEDAPPSSHPNASAAPDNELWEEEEATLEEQLIYFRAKGAVHDVEIKAYRRKNSKIVTDQERWDREMPELVKAYLDFCYRRHKRSLYDGEVKEFHTVTVWSLFDHSIYQVPVYKADLYHNTGYIRNGYLPFNPLVNASVVALDVVELYHNLFMRCPRLGIQPFIRTLCDLQGLRFKNYLAVQFSSAYDLYNRLVRAVRLRILEKLGRTTPNYRMLNACPSCQYEVEGEEPRAIRMMLAVDGNNSLRRFQRREFAGEGETLGPVKERLDTRVGGGDYFLQPEEVDLWDEPNWGKWPGWSPSREAKKNTCADRWSNMNEAKTKKSFGFFDVNGIFAGFCRHSFTIVFADMIRSGEQSKYLLAFLHHFANASREDRIRRGLPPDPEGELAVGYDIACGMVDKIARSPLNPLAQSERLRMLIGLLHGYAHNRLCQLSFLMLYVNGAGIEDLEVCERYFSQSNALAPVTRYMSVFHRRQAIANYAYHRDNFETYHNLSRFIFGNYKQALGILNRTKDTIELLRSLGITDLEIPRVWLNEEKQYLEERQKKLVPEEDGLKTSYYSALVKLSDCQLSLTRARMTYRLESGTQFEASQEQQLEEPLKPLTLTERQLSNLQELEGKLLADVHSLEGRLGLTRKQRWNANSEDWKRAKDLVDNAAYQKALDRLEGLIVARIFELSRLNVAGTGYKMRQHIGHAMKNRSAAIQTALKQYNQAAAALKPPRRVLSWDEVMNYTYLSEFDFLRDTRSDIREKPWAKPAVREAMSELRKLIGAGDELETLHAEIRRLLTYMKEEEAYIPAVADSIEHCDPELAFQIRLHGHERARFNDIHRLRIRSIVRLPGFTPADRKYFVPGVGIKRQTVAGCSVRSGEQGGAEEPGWEDEEDASEGEDEEAEVDDRAEAVLAVANDSRDSM